MNKLLNLLNIFSILLINLATNTKNMEANALLETCAIFHIKENPECFASNKIARHVLKIYLKSNKL